jgi:hypothetical protein
MLLVNAILQLGGLGDGLGCAGGVLCGFPGGGLRCLAYAAFCVVAHLWSPDSAASIKALQSLPGRFFLGGSVSSHPHTTYVAAK